MCSSLWLFSLDIVETPSFLQLFLYINRDFELLHTKLSSQETSGWRAGIGYDTDKYDYI